MNTTIVQPMPINSRFAPVMFASASEHGDSVPPSSGRHAAPVCANDSPPLRANTKSTAYSGSTAIRARIAIAKPAEMSSCATSAAQDSRNAAPTIAMPNSRASSGCAELGVGGTEHDRRHAEQHGDRDGDLGASRVNVVEIVAKGRHSVSH